MLKIYDYPKAVLAFIALVTIFFAVWIPGVEVNNDLYIFLGENNQAKIDDQETRDIFGEGEAMLLALHSPYELIISPQNLRRIDALSRALEALPRIEGVTSLTTAEFLDGVDGAMTVLPLIPDLEAAVNMPASELIGRLRSWENMYAGNLYTDDMRSTQIILDIEQGLALDSLEVLHGQVKALLKTVDTGDLEIYIAGIPAMAVELKEKMYGDMGFLIPVVVLVVIFSLWLSFRSLAGILLPLLTVAVSSIWTVGLMAFLDVPMTMLSTAIPAILISVGSAYGIHILSHSYDALHHDRLSDHRALILETLKKVGLPVILAGVTTIAGFASLSSSPIVPMRDGGLFLAFGVAVAIITALTMIPSVLILRGRHFKDVELHGEEGRYRPADRFLLSFYDLFSRHSIRNLILAVLIIIVSLIGAQRILIDTNMVDNFRPDTGIRRSDRFLNEHFGGTNMINVVVSGPGHASLLEPDILLAMDELGLYLEEESELVGKVIGFPEFVKRMNQIMHIPEETVSTPSTGSSGPSETEGFGGFGGEEAFGFSFEDFETEDESESGMEAEYTATGQGSLLAVAEGTASGVETPPSSASTLEELISVLNSALNRPGAGEMTAGELLQELRRISNDEGMAYYEIPSDPGRYGLSSKEELKNLISQYMLLYSGSLDGFIDDALEPQRSRMIVQISSPKNADTDEVERLVLEFAERRFPQGYTVKVTGTGKLSSSVNDLVIRSQTSSILSSLIIVFAIIALSFRSVTAGFFGIVTLLFSLLINFGVMGFLGIKLDMGSSMVASVAIGIGIDYSIHFLSRFRLEARRHSDEGLITRNTLLSAGKAILYNAFAVAAGFAVLVKSNFIPIENLGLLIALTMVTSSFAALTLLPALIHTFRPRFIFQGAS